MIKLGADINISFINEKKENKRKIDILLSALYEMR